MAVYEDQRGIWWASIEAGYTPAGKRRRIKRRARAAGDKGKVEAQRLERKLLREKNAGTLTVDRRINVKRYSDGWLPRQAERVRPTTYVGLQTMVRHTLPVIGDVKLAELTAGHIRAVTQSVLTDGRTSTTARDTQQRLVKMLRDAVRDGHQIPEAALLVELPGRAVTDRTSIPPDQARALLTAAADQPAGSRWVAAMLQGMRQGECLGLTWGCVDLAGGTVDVSWQLQSIPWQHGCGGDCGRRFPRGCPDRTLRVPHGYPHQILDGAWCLVQPKTARGQRIIPLVPWMRAALERWQHMAPASPHGLVWPADDGGVRTDRADTLAWTALQDQTGTRHPSGRHWHLHEARHTAATLLLEAGVDPHTVTAIMGHSSILTSRQYQHVSQALARQALEKVAAALGLPEVTGSDR